MSNVMLLFTPYTFFRSTRSKRRYVNFFSKNVFQTPVLGTMDQVATLQSMKFRDAKH